MEKQKTYKALKHMEHGVKVLQKHIKAGEQLNEERCPVALAINEHLDKFGYGITWRVRVRKMALWIRDMQYEENIEYMISNALCDWVTAFDNGEPVQPVKVVFVAGVAFIEDKPIFERDAAACSAR